MASGHALWQWPLEQVIQGIFYADDIMFFSLGSSLVITHLAHISGQSLQRVYDQSHEKQTEIIITKKARRSNLAFSCVFGARTWNESSR